MEAPQTLRRPSNWQDFESLCKKLWGEIWDCPEIQKNGRLGQEQFGVDVFGVPFGEKEFYGIQCKGKNEYTNSQFTKNEIDTEIEKAKKFKPSLRKLYFATTALSDSNIQTYIRTKNIEHLNNGFFEIHLFSWETIVDLIDENQQTHDWYLKNQNFKSKKSIKLTFENNETELVIKPKFRKRTTHYKQKIVRYNPRNRYDNSSIIDVMSFGSRKNQINYSFSKFHIHVNNIGSSPIEEYKVFLDFVGEIKGLRDYSDEGKRLINNIAKYTPNTYLWEETMSGKIIPKKSILVGDDTLRSEDIFLKPLSKEYEIIIKWKLISKDFKDSGELKLNVQPEIIYENREFLIEDPTKVGIVVGEVEDYID